MPKFEIAVRVLVVLTLLFSSLPPTSILAQSFKQPRYQTEEPPTTPTAEATATETPVPTDTPTPVPTETATVLPVETNTPTPTETGTVSPTEIGTPPPTETTLPQETASPTNSPTGMATAEATATAPFTLTVTPTITPTTVPTITPHADFVGNPLIGQTPLTVTFVNSSSNATSYYWNFGDGTTSVEFSPTHVYTQVGAYTVTLEAGDGVVTDTFSRVNYITPFELKNPQANFSGAPLSGSWPLTVTFINSSTNATTYQWDFGDGAVSPEIIPTHVYTRPGAYTVTLIASNGVVGNTLIRPAYVGVALDWWAKIQEDISKSEYYITWQNQTYLSDLPQAYHAPNRTHDLRIYFAPTGIRIIPRTETQPSWQWGLQLASYGYVGTPQAITATATLSAAKNGIEYRRGYKRSGQPLTE